MTKWKKIIHVPHVKTAIIICAMNDLYFLVGANSCIDHHKFPLADTITSISCSLSQLLVNLLYISDKKDK